MTEERKQQIQKAVSLLADLTKLRFPLPSPDLFTLRDFKVRYRLTQLGPIAIQAMEKSQRISRQQRDYTNIGLCEFHIGLIYLHNQDCLGGLQHFNNAQHQWQFVHEPNGTGLAFFAQGLTQHFNWQYEAAMASFNEVRRWLPRIALEKSSEAQTNFIEKLTDSLDIGYEALRKDLWRVTQPKDEQDTPLPAVHDDAAAIGPQPPSSPTMTVIPTDSDDEAIQDSALPNASLGYSYLIPPEHVLTDNSYNWYLVLNEPRSRFFPPEIQKGSSLLIHKRPIESIKNGELVIVEHEDDLLLDDETVRVQPLSGLSYSILTIAWIDGLVENSIDITNRAAGADQANERFNISTSSKMQHIPTKIKNIVGVVVGSWHPVTIE